MEGWRRGQSDFDLIFVNDSLTVDLVFYFTATASPMLLSRCPGTSLSTSTSSGERLNRFVTNTPDGEVGVSGEMDRKLWSMPNANSGKRNMR